MKANFRISQRHNLSSALAHVNEDPEPISRSQSSWRNTQHAKITMSRGNKHQSEYFVGIKGKNRQVSILSQGIIKNDKDGGALQRKMLGDEFKNSGNDDTADSLDADVLELSPQQIKDRFRILMVTLASLMSIQLFFLNVESIIPVYIERNHKQLNETHSSLIMIALEIASFLLSPVVGIFLERIGRKNSIISGFVVMTISTIGLGLTQHIEDDWWYLAICIIVRFLQGLGDIQVQTSCYSVLTSMFPENREKYLGMGEAAAGIGLMVGPVLGGILNTVLGYRDCFFVFSGILGLNIIISFFVLPNSLNHTQGEEDPDEEFRRTLNHAKLNISYWEFLTNRRVMFSYAACVVLCIMTSFSSGFLTIVLTQTMQIDEAYVGYILAIPASAYIISSILVNKFIEHIPRRIFMVTTFAIYFLGTLLLGPSQVFAFPNQLYLFFIGYFISGLAQGFLFIPILPEVIDSIYHKSGAVEGEDVHFDGIVSDKAAGLYGSFYSLGLIISPIVGSEIYQALDDNWNLTCDIFAFFAAGFCLIFFVFNVLPDILSDRKERLEMARKSQIVIHVRETMGGGKRATKGDDSENLLGKNYADHMTSPSQGANQFKINIISENGKIEVKKKYSEQLDDIKTILKQVKHDSDSD
eukprot:403372011